MLWSLDLQPFRALKAAIGKHCLSKCWFLNDHQGHVQALWHLGNQTQVPMCDQAASWIHSSPLPPKAE